MHRAEMLSSTTIAIIFAGLVGLASPQTIDPNSVPLATRQRWCNDQKSSCPLICLQLPNTTATPLNNNCDPNTLIYSCICSNGQQPNSSQYSLTIPYYICTETNDQCVNNCAGNNACQSSCRQDHPCGAQDPPRVNTTSSAASTTSATATGDAAGSSGSMVFTGYGGAAATQTAAGKSGAGSLALSVGRAYGVGIVATGLFTGFACLL